MKICFNSIFRILNYLFPVNLKDKYIIKLFIGVIDKNDASLDDSEISTYSTRYKKSIRDFTNLLREEARKLSILDIKNRLNKKEFSKYINLIKSPELFMNYVNELILIDETFNITDIIFTEPQIKKGDINNISLDFISYLANLIYFLYDKCYFEKGKILSDSDIETIKNRIGIQKPISFDTAELKTTNSDVLFNNTFHEVTNPYSLITKKPNDFKLFYLDASNEGFDYTKLNRYLLINIGNYIFSRQEKKDIIDEDGLSTLAIVALRDINKYGGLSGDDLGNILLYSFLECVLKAPKLFTNYEIKKSQINSKSNAIHLLSTNDGTTTFNQIIFGTSKIDNSLIDSIKISIDKLEEIKNDSNKLLFVNSSIFNGSFDTITALNLKELIVPSKTNSPLASRGYSLFVGYKCNVDFDAYSTTEEINLAVISQIKKDILDNYQEIEDYLTAKGLNSKSVYIYVLPLNNPLLDKDNIISKLLSI